MSLPVVLRAEAQDEFDEAFDWYEGRRPGLGVSFARVPCFRGPLRRRAYFPAAAKA